MKHLRIILESENKEFINQIVEKMEGEYGLKV